MPLKISIPRIRPRAAFLSLFVLGSVLYLGTAATPALVDEDVDAAHALVAREMLQRHDYVVMYMDGLRYLIRPPMHFWLVALSYRLFGESAFSTRLPVALAMILLVLLAYEFGRRFFSERAGFYGALVAATSAGMFVFTRIMIPEAIYALEFMAAFYLFLRAWTGSLDERIGYCSTAACCALGMLTRGPIGVLFPAGAIAVFITLTRNWHRWRELHLFSSLGIFLAIASPWHILAELRAPGFFWSYFINENVNRALGTRLPHDYGVVPLWLWWMAHLAWFFPWSIFLPLALRQCPAIRNWTGDMSPAAQARLLLFVWAGFILLFFSIERGSRMEYYSFGAWPAIALLIGLGLERAEKSHEHHLRFLQGGLAVAGMLVAFGIAFLTFAAGRIQASENVADHFEIHPADFYQTSMAHVFDLTPKLFANLRWPALVVAFSLITAPAAAWILRNRKCHRASNVTVALCMVAFFFAANAAYKTFEPDLSCRSLASAINDNFEQGNQIAVYGDIRVAPSIGFYTHQRLWLYNAASSNLEYGSRYADAPKVFLTDQDFPQLWNGKERVFLVVPDERNHEMLKHIPGDSIWFLAAEGKKVVYSNQPVCSGQSPVISAEISLSNSCVPPKKKHSLQSAARLFD